MPSKAQRITDLEKAVAMLLERITRADNDQCKLTKRVDTATKSIADKFFKLDEHLGLLPSDIHSTFEKVMKIIKEHDATLRKLDNTLAITHKGTAELFCDGNVPLHFVYSQEDVKSAYNAGKEQIIKQYRVRV